jgi:uncharacterized membrane protein YgaE (UPF0421/DUF939 family)
MEAIRVINRKLFGDGGLFPHIGFRIIKTAIAIILCLLIGYWLNQPPPIFACMAAVVVMRENMELSIRQSIYRVMSTVVGCSLAFLIMLINIQSEYLHILVTGAGCALTVYFCVLIKKPETASLSGIIFLSLAVTHPDDKYAFALLRLTETILGIAVSLGINALPFKHREAAAFEATTGE